MTISIEDFSVSLDDWVVVEDPIVFVTSITDTSVSGINPAATYYIVNGSQVATTTSGVDSTHYYISSAPIVVSGSMDLSLHIANYAGEILDKSYSFLFGYNVSFTSNVDWGANREIVVSAYASNTAICPHTERYTTYFLTREYDYVNLMSYIEPSGWADLVSTITPQTMQFIYGRTYTITVSGIKDYSGNELPAFSWNFTIENG